MEVYQMAMDPFCEAQACAEDTLQETLAYLSEAHQQEVRELREQVAQLNAALRHMHAVALCARIDEPDMESLKEQVAADIAQDPTGEQGQTQALTTNAGESTEVAGIRPSTQTDDFGLCGQSSFFRSVRSSNESAEAAQVRAEMSTASKSQKKIRPAGSSLDEREKQRKAADILKEVQKVQTPARRRANKSHFKPATRRVGSLAFLSDRSLQGMVEHPIFDTVCELAIVLNSILVGLDVELRNTDDYNNWIEFAQYACSIFFLLELVLRISAYGRSFFTGEDFLWSWFDTTLVGISIVDFFLSERVGLADGSTSSISSGVKTVRMVRIARVFRTFRFFRELSLLALMIRDSLRSLMWALLMLSIIVFVFAILFTQSAKDYLEDNQDNEDVKTFFGSIPRTVYSLLRAMLGGLEWGNLSDTLLSIHPALGGLFFFYIFFTMLAFLNVTTGVFVDNAVETARSQRDFLVQKETELKERYLAEMRDLFLEMDEDDSGTVNLEEVKQYFDDPRVHSYMAALGLDSADTERLFSLLDCNDNGDINIDEFLTGCLRLKGVARSIDMQHLLIDVQHLITEFRKLNEITILRPLRTKGQGSTAQGKSLV